MSAVDRIFDQEDEEQTQKLADAIDNQPKLCCLCRFYGPSNNTCHSPILAELLNRFVSPMKGARCASVSSVRFHPDLCGLKARWWVDKYADSEAGRLAERVIARLDSAP